MKTVIALCCLFSLGTFATAADGTSKPAMQALQDMDARRAGIYTESMNASNRASRHALEQVAAGKPEYTKVARACADCADMAGLTATLTARGSQMAEHAREALAKCCDMTVAECEKMNDPALSPCMEACKKAAKDCRDKSSPNP